jgi:riboflavin biosynthesis pyrimidine reductase
MKPRVICHMLVSVDGRIHPRRWRPREGAVAGLYEKLHDKIGSDAWIVGRVTGQEFAKAQAYEQSPIKVARENHYVRRDASAYAVIIDAEGKIAWGRADIGGDPIVVVLTRKVTDSHLAGLRADGVSYIFAGTDTLDLAAALDTLNRDLAIKRLLLEGGGLINGSFLRAGLIDELSMVVCPAIDGAKAGGCAFDSTDAEADLMPPVSSMRLDSSEVVDGNAVWLRYSLRSD